MYRTYLVQKTGFCVHTTQMFGNLRTSLLFLLPSLLSLSRINGHGDKYSSILASIELMNWTLFGQIQSEYLPLSMLPPLLFASSIPFMWTPHAKHFRHFQLNQPTVSKTTSSTSASQETIPPTRRKGQSVTSDFFVNCPVSEPLDLVRYKYEPELLCCHDDSNYVLRDERKIKATVTWFVSLGVLLRLEYCCDGSGPCHDMRYLHMAEFPWLLLFFLLKGSQMNSK